MSDTVQMSFRIRDERKGWFVHEMGKLARRATKLGVQAPAFNFGPFEDVVEARVVDAGEDENGTSLISTNEIVVRYWPCTVTGAAPKFEGWTLAATLQVLTDEKTGAPHVIVRSITETPAPARFRNAETASDCEHCETRRFRRDTFLVRHDDGTWKQVGRQCIRDFLGHKSPETIARMAEFLLAARELGEEGGFSGGGGRVCERWQLETYLGYVATVMEKWGWLSKSKAKELAVPKEPTAYIALRHMNPSKEDLRDQRQGKWERLTPTDAHKARAAEAIEWMRNLPEAEWASSDYFYNLHVIVELGVVEPRTLGYGASLIIACDKALERVRERQARPESNHVGTVGERVVLKLKLVKVQEIDRGHDGYGSVSYLHVFTDAAGNDLKWFGSSFLRDAKGDRIVDGAEVEIKATVKKHDEYKGRKQTMLTRAQLHVVVEKPKKNKANKAVAAGIVAAFEAIRRDEDIALGFCCMVAFGLGYLSFQHPDLWNKNYIFFEW
jgi:hypothetical protein